MQDPCGYDKHKRHRALVIPSAISLIIMGCSLSWFFRLLPGVESADAHVLAKGLDRLTKLVTKDLVDMSFSQSHILSSLSLVTCIGFAIAILERSRKDNNEYMVAFRTVPNFYTDEQRTEAKALRLRCVVVGAIVAVIALLSMLLMRVGVNADIAYGIRDALLAVAVWIIVYGCLMGARVHVYAYDFEAIRHTSIYELEKMPDGARKRLLIAEKRLSERLHTVKRGIWSVAVLAALALYFLPTLETKLYWMAFVVGGIASGIASLVNSKYAKRLLQTSQDDIAEVLPDQHAHKLRR